MRISIVTSLVALALAGCASSPGVYLAKPAAPVGLEHNRGYLAGKWLGEAPVREGGSKMWLNERSPDGTFVITFRNQSSQGDVEISQEYGVWGLSGDIYFTKTMGWLKNGEKRPVFGPDSYFDDAYVVKSLTASEFIYESVVTDEVFRTRKVPDDYNLP